MSYRIPRRRPSRKKSYAFVIPDVHVGYILDQPTYSVGAWDVAMQALGRLIGRATHVVILGDFGNWESMTHWSGIRAEQAFIEEDVALVNARLDEIEAITKPNGIKVAFCEGNHEAWCSLFEAKYPVMRDVVNLKRRLRFKERGWTWVPENHFYAIGDLHFTHGHIRGVRSPIDMIRRKGVSVMYGHVHSEEIANVRTLTGEHMAMACGCLASIDPPPPYAKGELPDSWVHGFATARIRSDGSFQAGFSKIYGECWTEMDDGTELIARPKEVRYRLAQDAAIREQLREEYADRFYNPGGPVVRTEPHHGKARINKHGEQIISPVARTRRARIVKSLED